MYIKIRTHLSIKIHFPIWSEKKRMKLVAWVRNTVGIPLYVLYLLAFSLSCATLACPSFAWMWTLRSKKPTMAGSFSSEARTCSKENDQSVSDWSAAPSWLLWELETSDLFRPPEASLVEVTSAEAAVLAGLVALGGGLLGSCSLRPTSSILRRRLVTWATAR